MNDVLVMNEPNLINQANMTPTAFLLGEYEAFQAEMLEQHGCSIRLVGPAMTWGTRQLLGPRRMADAFYDAFNESEGKDPHIDVLAFHWLITDSTNN